MSKRTWLSEFGSEYEIPSQVLDLPRLVDTSWHNDSCPSFTLQQYEQGSDMPLATLWIEHPEKSKREPDYADRYLVQTDDFQAIYSGDNLAEALSVF